MCGLATVKKKIDALKQNSEDPSRKKIHALQGMKNSFLCEKKYKAAEIMQPIIFIGLLRPCVA